MLQKQGKANTSLLHLLGVGCCLLPFLLGQFQQLVFHQLEHSHLQTEQHTAADEADPCHRSIFHEGAADTCDHPTHLGHAEQECQWCHSLLLPLSFSLKQLLLEAPEAPASEVFFYQGLIERPTLRTAPARGPPVMG
jgi:hypothetical protein